MLVDLMWTAFVVIGPPLLELVGGFDSSRVAPRVAPQRPSAREPSVRPTRVWVKRVFIATPSDGGGLMMLAATAAQRKPENLCVGGRVSLVRPAEWRLRQDRR
jgi:hypothetical protein